MADITNQGKQKFRNLQQKVKGYMNRNKSRR